MEILARKVPEDDKKIKKRKINEKGKNIIVIEG